VTNLITLAYQSYKILCRTRSAGTQLTTGYRRPNLSEIANIAHHYEWLGGMAYWHA